MSGGVSYKDQLEKIKAGGSSTAACDDTGEEITPQPVRTNPTDRSDLTITSRVRILVLRGWR